MLGRSLCYIVPYAKKIIIITIIIIIIVTTIIITIISITIIIVGIIIMFWLLHIYSKASD